MQIDNLHEFFEANRGLPMKKVQENAQDTKFSSLEWIQLHKMSTNNLFETSAYNLKVTALKKALETATSLSDWVRLADYVKAPYRDKARNEVLKFDVTTQEDVDVLRKSDLFRPIGWYINAKRKIEIK